MDSYRLENCFYDLLNVFSEKNASAFSSCLFSVKCNTSNLTESFKKLIYNNGNQEEVYTKKERLIIDSICNFSVCSEFYIYDKHQRILCRLIAFDLTKSASLVYDALAVMKICNKALNGFNIYIIVGSDSIHIGCDMLGGESKTSCLISYPITNKVNWESLIYIFSDVTEDEGFLKYYYSLLNTILSVFDCYDNADVNLHDTSLYHQFEDDEDNWYDPSDESLYHDEQEPFDNYYELLSAFEYEVEDAKKELDFIKTNRVNSLEMLYEAEKQTEDTKEYNQHYDYFEEKNNYSEELHSLLSNPDELIKVLKNKNK